MTEEVITGRSARTEVTESTRALISIRLSIEVAETSSSRTIRVSQTLLTETGVGITVRSVSEVNGGTIAVSCTLITGIGSRVTEGSRTRTIRIGQTSHTSLGSQITDIVRTESRNTVCTTVTLNAGSCWITNRCTRSVIMAIQIGSTLNSMST